MADSDAEDAHRNADADEVRRELLTVEVQVVEAQVVETQVVESQVVESQLVEAQVVESQVVESAAKEAAAGDGRSRSRSESSAPPTGVEELVVGGRVSSLADGGRVLMIMSTVVAVFVLLLALGILDWSLPLAASRTARGSPTSAGANGRVLGDGADAGSSIRPADVAALASDLAAAGWPSLALSAEHGGLRISGSVANADERAEVLALAAQRFVGLPIEDRLTISAGEPAYVTIGVSQSGLLLEGTVPNREMAEELLVRARMVYLEDQIDDRLVVDPRVGTPLAITASGNVTNATLIELVTTQFSGIVGVDPLLVDQLVLSEPSAVEDALNSVGEIRFASGSGVILSESGPVLDEAAAIIGSSPQLAIEIGAHVMIDGDDGAASTLSQVRADVVRAELLARGAPNELVARGFGPSRIVAASRQADGRQVPAAVEFRLLD